MQSLASVFRAGHGPSSSHTMGPVFAVQLFRKTYPQIRKVKVILYGSLALTGKGHLTDKMILKAFLPIKAQILFNLKLTKLPHPNTLDIIGTTNNKKTVTMRVISIGGGEIKVVGNQTKNTNVDVYPLSHLNEILQYCQTHKIHLIDYIKKYEPQATWDHLQQIWITMQQAIAEGLKQTKILPGKIGYARKAKLVYDSKSKTKNPLISCTDHKLMAYAYASSEQNAGGGVIVTAPTCGSCGVLPAVLLSAQQQLHLSNQKIHEALAVAGLIGNITRTNATIAGAQAGCQAEIGVASAMAAAAYAHILGLSDKKIMNAATNALEHHLGLTCDPVLGYVQVPCIERNVFAARQAITSASLCTYTNEAQMWNYDEMIDIMMRTGKDLKKQYRETSLGGLARAYLKKVK